MRTAHLLLVHRMHPTIPQSLELEALNLEPFDKLTCACLPPLERGVTDAGRTGLELSECHAAKGATVRRSD